LDDNIIINEELEDMNDFLIGCWRPI